jgi:hypothetical protein
VVASRRGVAIPSNLTPDKLDLRESTADVGDCDYTKPARPLCPRGDPHGDNAVVVTGDSHALAWIPAFDEIAAHEGWTAYYLAKPRCSAPHATMGKIDTGDPSTACSKFHDWVSQQVATMHPDLVVVASAPPVKGVYDDEGDLVESIDRMTPVLDRAYGDLFEDLGRNAGRVVLIRDVPKAERDPAVCLTDGRPDLGDCMFHPKERTRKIGAIAVAAAREHGVDVVDPWPWLCWQDDCPVVVGSTISYRDNDHLSVPYSRQLAAPLAEALGFDPQAWH